MTVKRVMIIEDEWIFAGVIAEYLEEMGYEVGEIVPSGDIAFEKASEFKPDIILMDIKIEGKKDGIDVAKEVYEKLDIPVIFLTAYSDKKTLDRAKKTYPFGYFMKPIDEKQLKSAIVIALNRHEEEMKIKKRNRELQSLVENGEMEITVKFVPKNKSKQLTEKEIKEAASDLCSSISANFSDNQDTATETNSNINNISKKNNNRAFLKNPEDHTPKYLIKEVTRETRVEPNVIRRYEKEGLLKPYRRPMDNFRRFTKDEIAWVKRIWDLIHEQGLNIEGIRRILTTNKCWEFFQCDKNSREKCPIYKENIHSCWSGLSQESCCFNNECYKCDYYIESKRNPMFDV